MTTSSSLIVTKPIAITSAMITSTDVPETDHAAWAVGSTYALGARVILTSTHKIYESVQAGNVGKDPATQTAWWTEVSATNRFKCFDTSNSTRTVTAGGATPKITYELLPGQAVNSLAVLNVIGASSLTVTVTDPVYGVVYNKTVSFATVPALSEWWAWFFGERKGPSQAIFKDLPSYPSATIKVELTGGTSLGVGVIMLGQQKVFGVGVLRGARVGIQDYSRIEVNDFGDTVLVQRAYAKRNNISMLIESTEVDTLQDFLASVRAVPCLWVCSSAYESLVIYGFYKNFDILISYAQFSETSLEIQGLT